MAKRNTVKKRIELKSVLIALEDTKSSKYYFQELLKDKKLIGKVIFAKHTGTDPESVVDAIVLHKEKNGHVKYEKEWAVFDRDSWTKSQVNSAINRAKALKICVSISNEAYELWILLHFEKLERYTTRQDLNSKLNKHFKDLCGQDYSKSSQDVYRYIIGKQAKAIKNSENLVKKHLQDHGKIDPEKNNPITLIYQLVNCLNTLYEDNKDCDCFPLKET